MYLVAPYFQNGADPTKKNRDGATPLDLVKEGDQDVADLLRGNAALLDAAKKGNLARIERLLTPENMNCCDLQGRNSTPLHLAGTCAFGCAGHRGGGGAPLDAELTCLFRSLLFRCSGLQQYRSGRIPTREGRGRERSGQGRPHTVA